MKLKDLPVLFLDGQTTGMRPTSGQLLEIAWALAKASDEAPVIESHLLALPEGQSIPRRVSELTGLKDEDLARGESFDQVLSALRKTAAALPEPALSVIHYASFEKPFLNDLFSRGNAGEPPFELICSHALSKKLFPNLPSQNIRGTAGFFGNPIGTLKRAGQHVYATFDIWRGLIGELERKGVLTVDELRGFMAMKNKPEKGRYIYRMPVEKRLALPDAPGIYRMLAKNGEVLYVGKATSLKSRVNSYFRGKAGRDKRKLEMMAQVWDLKVTECRSALEAALMEADEIKKFNPPYNVVMKSGQRNLVFYARDFSSASRIHGPEWPIGPFRDTNWIEPLRLLSRSLSSGEFEQIFYQPLPADQLERAFRLFCANRGLDPRHEYSVRECLALGLKAHRHFAQPEEKDEETGSEDPNAQITDEDVAGKYERLLIRAGRAYWRAKVLTKMLNTRVTYVHQGEPRVLDFQNGLRLEGEPRSEGKKLWHDLGVETFDRMSVLLSELEKYEHRIERVF